jgi:NADPH:quinone reductase-like Zn-dependent oxidoreductase
MSSMKAVVIREAGGPDVLNVETMAVPTPKSGWVLIRVRAFGLNRSELFTRQGHSPNVPFPRVLGIEAVGEVISAPDGGFGEGDTVATAMGGMGRDYDGRFRTLTRRFPGMSSEPCPRWFKPRGGRCIPRLGLRVAKRF